MYRASAVNLIHIRWAVTRTQCWGKKNAINIFCFTTRRIWSWRKREVNWFLTAVAAVGSQRAILGSGSSGGGSTPRGPLPRALGVWVTWLLATEKLGRPGELVIRSAATVCNRRAAPAVDKENPVPSDVPIRTRARCVVLSHALSVSLTHSLYLLLSLSLFPPSPIYPSISVTLFHSVYPPPLYIHSSVPLSPCSVSLRPSALASFTGYKQTLIFLILVLYFYFYLFFFLIRIYRSPRARETLIRPAARNISPNYIYVYDIWNIENNTINKRTKTTRCTPSSRARCTHTFNRFVRRRVIIILGARARSGRSVSERLRRMYCHHRRCCRIVARNGSHGSHVSRGRPNSDGSSGLSSHLSAAAAAVSVACRSVAVASIRPAEP